MGEMHPDLMGAAGLEFARKKGSHRLAVGAIEAFDDFPMGDGVAASFTDRHFFPRVRMPVDRGIDRAALPVRHPPDESEVAAPHLAGLAVVGELRRQRL